MAEQQLTQEQLGQEQQLDGLQEPVPKTNQTVTPAPAIVPQQPKFGDISAITEPIKPKKQQQVLPTKKAKKLEIGDLSGAEMAFEQHATFAKANKAGAAVTSSMIGSMTGPSTPFVYATQQEANAQMQQTKANEQKALIQKNSAINDLVKNKVPDKISDYLFGSFDDIIKFGGSVEKYIKKNTAGVEYIDEGLLRKDMDEAISAQGINAGRYLKTFLWSKVGDKQNLNTILSTFQGRDDIAKKMTGGNTEAQQKAFLLSKQTDVKNRFKGQIETEERLLQEKVRKIQEKYSSAISDASVDANFYWAAAQDKAMKQLEGITGVYQPALQQSFERRAKEIFDTEYAQFVSPKYDQIADSIAADIKIEVSKTNDAVKRINKEMDVAFKAEAETYLKGFNQAQIDQFTKDIGSIIDSKTKAREEQNKGYAQSLIDMSGMSGMVGTTAIGKILTETGMSALGSLKSKAALVLNALGFEADAIDAMKYSGKTTELSYSIEKLPLGQNWFKPGYWAQSIAQSGPSMAAGMLTTALTKNPYIGGIIAFGSESIENSGGVMERVLENTGDMEAARAAGQESFIKNFPTVLSEVLTQRMFAPLSALKAAKTPVGQRLNQLATGVASNYLEGTWQAATEMSTGSGAKLGFFPAFITKEAQLAGIEEAAVGGIFGGAGIVTSASYKALLDKKNFRSIRTQSLTAIIINNGEAAAIAGVQLDALANDMDEETLGEGMKEVQMVAKTIEEAKQIGLNPQQTQIFASLSQEVVELKNTLNNVTDPSARKAVEKQIAAKEKEIEGVVNGTTPLATIEIQPGVVFTSTPDGVKNVMNTPEVKEEVAAGNVKIYTDDAGLNAEVDKVKAEAPARQRNIISDTGEIIAQVPTEAAPATETTPITQTQIPQDATQISERPQQEVGQPSNLVQRPRVEEGQPQERQAEGPIGETAQPSPDTRNRDFGSQAQQAVQEITALPEQTPAIQNYTRTINPGQEVQLMDELAQQVTEGEDRAVRQLGQPVVDKVKQWIADTGYTAPAVPAAPMAEAAPVTEAAPVNVDELLTADTKEPTNLEKVFNFLDGIDKAIGKELNSGKLSDATRVIPLAAIQTMVKALKALVQGGMALQDAIRKVAADNNYTEKDVTDAMKKVAEIEKVGVMAGMTDEQIKERKKQERLGRVYNTPQAQQLIETAKQDAASAKTAKLTPTKAYEAVLAKVKEGIDKIYSSGNYPDGVAWINMMQVAPAIARDAVNAAFPRAKKLSIQEAEMASMSTREYIRSIVSNQMNAIGKVKDRAKAIQAAISKVIDTLKTNFGTDFSLASSAIKALNKNLFDAVFSKMDDSTAIDEIIAKVTPVVEYAIRRQMLSNTAKLLDKIRSNYKLGRYSGAARLSIMENLLNADARKWLNSDATLEDISIFNQYLKELTGKNINTNNIDAAVALSNQFVPSPQQSTIAEKDSLNNKIKNLIKKVAAGQLDFKDYGMLVNLEKAINDINERKGALTGLTQQEQDEIIQNYNDLVASLPKPIDQLLDDAKTQIDADIKSKVDSLGTAIEASQEFRDSIKNPLLYEAVLRFKNEMTDDFINSLTPKEKMQLSANIDEILRGNPNSTTYEFSAKAGAFKKSNTNYKFGKDILVKRQVINNSGITGFFGKVRRLFMDIDFNRASAERMAASFDLFKFHMMDVELNTGVDEFGMGVLEREIFNPIARAIDSAFNKVTESLGAMQEAMKLLNDKSNKVAIKKGIGLLNKELGTGFFGGKAKWMHIKKLLGYGNSFYMEISTRMATIIATQIDHISNLEEGESPMDVVLLRNILEQKPDDYDGRTMKEHYETNPSAITDKTDDSSLFDHIAYGILTKGGVNKLSDLTKEQLLDLLTDSQRQAIAKWREHIDNTRNVVEAAMIMRGGVTAFLNEYFPRRVFSKEGVTEIKDIEEYLAQAGGNVGVDSGQLKSRRGEVGRLDLNGNSVLYNNLKDIYLIHEVKPVLDSLKGLDNAVERLKKERDLGAATYAEAVSIAVANRVKNSLESNERISNNNYSFWYKTASQVSSLASRVILISQLRQAFADFPSNVVKLSAALGFANRSMKNQVLKVVTPEMSSYTTDKGKFKWDDYVKIALTTGSSVHRIMSVYADNFLYEFSKPKEQLQREQRVASWQDMAVKKRAWMSRFEEAFNRITGEYLDHQAFADERSAYRAMYFDAVQKASDAADSLVDRQFGLASIARQPIRVNIAAPFVGRAIRNLFGKSPTIAKNNPASVILGFLTGYPTTQFQLFNRYMRSALSVDKDISAKQRTEDVSRALTEVIVPSVMYNVIRAATGTLFTTVAAAALVAGDDEEDRKRLYKEMESMPFWKRWFTKTRLVINEKQESFRNAVINGMLSSAVDPNVNAIVRPAAGFFLFKAWKENVIEDMTKSGKTKEEIQETRQKIKEYENTLFETYSIRPIELFGTKEYQEGIKRYYSAGAQSEGVEDLIKSTGGFGILYNEASRSMDLAKLIDSTDENKNLSETELYVASALKLGGITFSNIILGGKAGAALSMFSGDMNKVANMIISDQKSIQTGFEISQKKEGKKKNGGMRSGGLRSEGLGGGGLRSEGLR